MLLVTADGNELGQVAVVADDRCRMDDDGTAVSDVESVADLRIPEDLDRLLGPVQSPEKKSPVSGKALRLAHPQGVLETEGPVQKISLQESGKIALSIVAFQIASDIVVHGFIIPY